MSVSLRARLLISTVVVVMIGLLVANVATYRFLSSFLLNRVDEQLIPARTQAARVLSVGASFGRHEVSDLNLPPGTYAELRDGVGTYITGTFFGFRPVTAGRPILRWSDLPGSEYSADRGALTLTARAAGGSPTYRVLATSIPPGPGRGTFIVAIPLTEVGATLHRLVVIEGWVSAAVLLLTAGLALWLVRLGLRPLVGMGETAGAIAAGDLSRRVEPADGRTEVGRLGLALNSMLAQIEAAFEERKASEERLRRFVSDASHELRTPLTSIRGYSELFRRGADSHPEDLAKTMRRIEEEASRMGVLVDDLLLLARLDQGRPLERERVDLCLIAADAVDSARAVEPDRPIELDAPGEAFVLGDGNRLRQVLDNLLDNVRVHTPEGSPVRVAVTREDGLVVLSVADQGPGLEPEVAARAFERFYRGDPARSRATGGAGLGLSIVSAIVAAHAGEARVFSSAGSGATFEVRLPATDLRPANAEAG
ncbi:MAG: HAMP domain-containing sensor histidine kinase [Actinomycetota bacterium]